MVKDFKQMALFASGRRGRPPVPNKILFRSVGLTRQQWEYLALWSDTENPSLQLRELLDRACKFWPSGPAKFR